MWKVVVLVLLDDSCSEGMSVVWLSSALLHNSGRTLNSSVGVCQTCLPRPGRLSSYSVSYLSATASWKAVAFGYELKSNPFAGGVKMVAFLGKYP
jgi:hypothetical protein